MLDRIRDKNEIAQLKKQLDQAVQSEDFEDAARFRDELKQIKDLSQEK